MAKGNLAPGAVLGDYEILGELGRGGMGVVYKAHRRTLNRTVALKVLPARYAQDSVFIQRFEREARAAAALNHPHTVRVFAVGEDHGHHFIAMQFVEGQTLKERIAERGRLGVDDALAITRQVAGALGEAHGLGMIHRDIKPANIMVDRQGRAVLMDFGLAKGMQSNTQLTAQGVQVGTPLYMSPEQIQGRPVDGRTDIYSLGLTLYEMLAGKSAYEPAPMLAMMYQVLQQPIPKLADQYPDVPLNMEGLIANMTAKEVGERYASAADLCADLDAVARGELPRALGPERESAVPPDKPAGGQGGEGRGRVPGLLKQRRVQIVAAGVVVALIALLGAVFIPAQLEARRAAAVKLAKAEQGARSAKSSAQRQRERIGSDERQYSGQHVVDGDRNWAAAESKLSWAASVADYDSATRLYKQAEGHYAEASRVTSAFKQAEEREPVDTRTFAGIEMVRIIPGSFDMGSPSSEEDRDYDETQHRVTLTEGFWLGKYEVTQAQWQAVMGSNPSEFEGPNLPVENVSWEDCQEFIARLSAEDEGTFWLPTEAEWEYACRAGSRTSFCSGDSDSGLGEYAWYGENSAGSTHPVGQKRANAWGLHDMHGNVREWCEDWEESYPSGPVRNPTGPSRGWDRVLRGGSWNHSARHCRSAARDDNTPNFRYSNLGFRVMRTP